MAQRLTTSFINTVRPGSYFDLSVKSTPVGVASSGNIVIIGEADGGNSINEDTLKDNYFTPDQADKVVKKYVSGPIVDAFRILASPSSDVNITGSANRIYIAKTNTGTKSSAVIGPTYGTLKAKNQGKDGDKIFYRITSTSQGSYASHTGEVISDFSLLAGVQFGIRLNGGEENLIDVFTGAPTAFDTISEVISLLSSALGPLGFSCVSISGKVYITPVSGYQSLQSGTSQSFELIDINPGDLSALGLTPGLYSASSEPSIQVDVKRTDINLNESFLIDSEVALAISYTGDTASITIDSSSLTTTVSGGAGSDLNLKLSDFKTLKELADLINSKAGYSCSVVLTLAQASPSVLDQVSDVGICTTTSVDVCKLKKASYNFVSKVSQSSAVDFLATSFVGLPDLTESSIYLSGGLKGYTTSADVVVTCLNACETIDVNFVVPLFSRDADDDIADNLTDVDSSYSISSINASVKNHVLKMSTAKIKKHRQAFLSLWDSYQNVKAEAASLANARISLSMQKSSQVDSQGNTVSFLPWFTACVASGMQAAGFYRAIINKFANVISYEDPSGFDSGSPGDIEDALLAGILFLEKAVVGNKWVSDQTTYGIDTNFVYNSIQAMYTADLVALDLTNSFETAFVGQSLADVDASVAISFLASKMSSYRQQKLIAPSADTANGFKNAKVVINGPIMEVSVEIKLATAIYFIPISIEVSQVQSAA
jgi:hypothetical protein